jgi:hypothetical protein
MSLDVSGQAPVPGADITAQCACVGSLRRRNTSGVGGKADILRTSQIGRE